MISHHGKLVGENVKFLSRSLTHVHFIDLRKNQYFILHQSDKES